MLSIRKILPSALFLSLPIFAVNYSYAMESNEFSKPKLPSVIATKGEMEELTSEDIKNLIINLKERTKDKSKKPIEIRKDLWASLKTPELTLRNLEEALKNYPGVIAILADTLDVKRPQTTMGVDHEGPISQFTLYFGEEEINPRVRFNVAFSQQKSLPSQSSLPLEKKSKKHRKKSVAADESDKSMLAVSKASKRSNHRLVPPETIEGESLERILWILKDFNQFVALGEKDLHVIPRSSTHVLAEGQKESPKAYDMQPVELEINGKRMTFKYADAPVKMAYIRKALEDVSLKTITALLEGHDPQPYATQGEKSKSLLCRYALYRENGEQQLEYKSHSGKVLPVVIEMTINLQRD